MWGSWGRRRAGLLVLLVPKGSFDYSPLGPLLARSRSGGTECCAVSDEYKAKCNAIFAALYPNFIS
jgi:hypothetical protein